MINATQIKPLKDLCDNFKNDIVDGPFGSNMKRSDYVTEGIPVLKIQNIKPFSITLKKMDFVKDKKFNELKRHSYKNGDIIMTKLGDPLGASAIVEGLDEGLIVADLVRIRARMIDTNYLCYHLNSPVTQDNINSQQKGATRPRVKIVSVRELPIYAPSPEKQKQLVAILDQAFVAIDQTQVNIQQNIQNAQDLFQSKLNQIFSQQGEGWEEKRLIEITEIRPPKKRVLEKVGQEDQVSFVPMKYLPVDQMYLESGETKTLKEVYSGYVCFEDGDVILAKITPCFENGKLGIAKNLKNGVGFGSSEYVVYRVDKNKVLPEYLYFYLNRDEFRRKGKSLMSGAVGHKRIQPDFYSNEIILMPSIKDQNDICNQVVDFQMQLNMLVSKYQTKSKSLEELKKSLLQKAFTGELT